jgi:hypothetical protein
VQGTLRQVPGGVEEGEEQLRGASARDYGLQQVNQLPLWIPIHNFPYLLSSIYMENMAFVFEKCQRMEMKRIRFVVEMFSGMQKILVDLLNPPK